MSKAFRRSYASPPPWHASWVELACFLGEAFRPEWCNDRDEKVFAEVARYPDVVTFYRESDILCYQGIAYFLQGWKRRYHAILFQLGMGALSILDYGCGTGCDGLWFLDAGFAVTFADMPGRLLDFCRWRLDHRAYGDLATVVMLVDDDEALRGHHVVWAMDVIEHLPPGEQLALLDRLPTYGNVVIVNLIEDQRADGAIHFPVDRAALVAHVGERWAYLAQDMHVMPDGNVTTLLVYGRGVTRSPDGDAVLVDAHGVGL